MLDRQTREFVRARARNRREYCRMHQEYASNMAFPVDHIIANQHGGSSTPDNLCLSCLRCNLQKGPNIAGRDELSGKLVPLFNPRHDAWEEHFRVEGCLILGVSEIGRVTVRLLGFNHEQQVHLRKELISDGWPLM